MIPRSLWWSLLGNGVRRQDKASHWHSLLIQKKKLHAPEAERSKDCQQEGQGTEERREWSVVGQVEREATDGAQPSHVTGRTENATTQQASCPSAGFSCGSCPRWGPVFSGNLTISSHHLRDLSESVSCHQISLRKYLWARMIQPWACLIALVLSNMIVLSSMIFFLAPNFLLWGTLAGPVGDSVVQPRGPWADCSEFTELPQLRNCDSGEVMASRTLPLPLLQEEFGLGLSSSPIVFLYIILIFLSHHLQNWRMQRAA